MRYIWYMPTSLLLAAMAALSLVCQPPTIMTIHALIPQVERAAILHILAFALAHLADNW